MARDNSHQTHLQYTQRSKDTNSVIALSFPKKVFATTRDLDSALASSWGRNLLLVPDWARDYPFRYPIKEP